MDPNSNPPNDNPPQPTWPVTPPLPGVDSAPDASSFTTSTPTPATTPTPTWTPSPGIPSPMVTEPSVPVTNWPTTTPGASPIQSGPTASPAFIPAFTPPLPDSGINNPTPTFPPPLAEPTPTPQAPNLNLPQPTPPWLESSVTEPASLPTPPSTMAQPLTQPVTTPVSDQSGGFSWTPTLNADSSNSSLSDSESAAPTDLSQLIDNNSAPTVAATETPVPETIVAPTAESDQVAVGDTHKGFPKILLIVAAVVLLLVAGASAYFILGIGQPRNGSLPAEQQQTQQPLTNPPKQAAAPEAPVQPQTPASPSDATFGNLSGATQSATPPASGSASAIELLRQRQAAGR